MVSKKGKEIITTHRFLDEAGDTTFYGKKKGLIIGKEGVSLSFSLGMVKISDNLQQVRERVLQLRKDVEQDDYLNIIPSVKKKIEKGGFYFHASDDPPEVRQIFYKFIKSLECSLEIVVARKIPEIFSSKHNNNETEFYGDILSHLIKNKLKAGNKLVLNIARRSNSTSNKNLQTALNKAISRAEKKFPEDSLATHVTFNVQNHRVEPLLNISDYMCWCIQRVFERGEMRYYDFLRDKISVVVDLYDSSKYEGSRNYYRRNNPLTATNKLSPPSS
jgi:hypothetical protein